VNYVLLVHIILSHTLFFFLFWNFPFTCFGNDILYGCFTVRAKAVSWPDLLDEAAEDCPINFRFRQDYSG
jgi:hypothetical protein